MRLWKFLLWPVLVASTVLMPCALAHATFTPAQLVADNVKWVNDFDLAVDDSGRAFVAWLEGDGDSAQLRGRWLDPAGITGPVIDISEPGSNARSTEVVATDGRAFVAWLSQSVPDGARSIKGRWLEFSGLVGPTIPIMDTTAAYPWTWHFPQVSLGTDGRVSVVAPTGPTIGLRRVDGTGALSPQTSFGNSTYPNVELAPRPDGGTIAVSGAGEIVVQTIDNAGGAGAVTPVSISPYAREPRVAVDGRGRALVAWWWSQDLQYANFRARLLDVSGEPIGDELMLDDVGIESILAPGNVAGGPSGFVAAWPKLGGPPSQDYAWARGISDDGSFLGPAQRLSPSSVEDVGVSLGSDGNGLVSWTASARLVNAAGAPTSDLTDFTSSVPSDNATSAFSRRADAAALAWRSPGHDGAPDKIFLTFHLGSVSCRDVAASTSQGVAVSIPLSCIGPGISGATVLGAPTHGEITGLPRPGALAFVYRPAKDFVGTDDFSFSATNAVGAWNVAHARISVSRAATARGRTRIFRLRISRHGGLRLILKLLTAARLRIVVSAHVGSKWKKLQTIAIKRKRAGTVRVRLSRRVTASQRHGRTLRLRVVAKASSGTSSQRLTRILKAPSRP